MPYIKGITNDETTGKSKTVDGRLSYPEWKEQYVDGVSTEGQAYKPVTIDAQDSRKDERKGNVIKSHRVQSSYSGGLYVDDDVRLKPRKLHEIEKNLSQAFTLLERIEAKDKPIVILSNAAKMPNVAGIYNAMRNIMLINIDPLKFANRDVVLPEIPLSTYVHELIHWMDAKEYEKKHRPIQSVMAYQGYIQWIRQKGKKVLDDLKSEGYDVSSISDYATRSVRDGAYEEFYTEYRVLQYMKILKGKGRT